MPSNLIENLRRFNRKERFYLIGYALGNESFSIGANFKEALEKELGVRIPETVFAAMDYHLDWIYASIMLTADGSYGPRQRPDSSSVSGTQEDIDFLVAFEDGASIQLILVEAKGVTPFSNRQMLSKATRLKSIFPSEEARKVVIPHFVVASPSHPVYVDSKDFPNWMMKKDGEFHWIKLPIGDSLLKVTRCTEGGKPDSNGKHRMIVDERGFGITS